MASVQQQRQGKKYRYVWLQLQGLGRLIGRLQLVRGLAAPSDPFGASDLRATSLCSYLHEMSMHILVALSLDICHCLVEVGACCSTTPLVMKRCLVDSLPLGWAVLISGTSLREYLNSCCHRTGDLDITITFLKAARGVLPGALMVPVRWWTAYGTV